MMKATANIQGQLAFNQLTVWYLQHMCAHMMPWSPREFIIKYRFHEKSKN